MNKIFLVGVLIMVVCGGLFLAGFDDRKIEYKNKIDTGMTPGQTWEIINGEDVGEVLNLVERRR